MLDASIGERRRRHLLRRRRSSSMLHAFASGGTAVTGVEAISNGVTAFKKPEWQNARRTLVIMGCVARRAVPRPLDPRRRRCTRCPYEDGHADGHLQVGKLVFGGGAVGNVLFYALQAATMLILVLAANTSFADFPRLASFHAGDNFMPKQLTKRGHRLVFSNGIIVARRSPRRCSSSSTGAKVERLIPLYAIGVFTSFTLSQAGMAKHHLTQQGAGLAQGHLRQRDRRVPVVRRAHHRRRSRSSRDGAWVIIVIVPILVVAARAAEPAVRGRGAPARGRRRTPRSTAPILRRHVVLVFVARLDQSTARAIQYARTLMPDEMRAVHIAWDRAGRRAARRQLAHARPVARPARARRLPRPSRRRAPRSTSWPARSADGKTEVTVLLPHRLYRRFWHRLLHDNTGDEIATAVSKLEHANVTMVPFQMGEPVAALAVSDAGDIARPSTAPAARSRRSATSRWRTRAADPGPHPLDAGPAVGRRRVARVRRRRRDRWRSCSCSSAGGRSPGSSSVASSSPRGWSGSRAGYLAMLNPDIELLGRVAAGNLRARGSVRCRCASWSTG